MTWAALRNFIPTADTLYISDDEIVLDLEIQYLISHFTVLSRKTDFVIGVLIDVL